MMTYRKLLTLLAVLATFNSFAQSKMAISVTGGMGYSYRSLNSLNNGKISEKYVFIDDSDLIRVRDSLEKGRVAMDLGVSLEYDLSEKVSMQLGIHYVSFGETEVQILSTSQYINLNGNTVIMYNEPEEFKFIYSYRYLQIPLLLNTYFVKNTMELGLYAGLGFNFLLNSSMSKPDNEDQIFYEPIYKTEYSEVNNFVLGFNGGLTIGYKLNDLIVVSLSPHLMYHLTPTLNMAEEINQRNYYTGITIGGKIRL